MKNKILLFTLLVSSVAFADFEQVLPISRGGTSKNTQQAALDAIAGAVTSGDYIRCNGTHCSVAAIQSGDVPVLNQDSTGASGKGSTTSVSTNSTFFPLFVPSSTNSNQVFDLGTGLTFNPSTNTLSTTTFSGALNGNASTATSATNATNAANIAIANDTTTNATMYPVWANNTSGNLAPTVSNTKLSFNPSTGVVTATGFAGAGSSITALNASNISSGTVPIANSEPATQALGTCTTAKTVDWSTGNAFTVTLTSGNACTLTFSNPTSAQAITIDITNGISGGTATVVWPTAKWYPAGAPTMTTGTGALDTCTCRYNGSFYACSCLQNGG